jgi:LacI family transcriptional regulator
LFSYARESGCHFSSVFGPEVNGVGRGLILVGRSHHPDLDKFLEKQQVPYVFTFAHDEIDNGVCIGPDNRKAMFDLTNYLLSLGHRCLAILAQSTHNNDRAKARLSGIHDALAAKQLAVRPQHIAIGSWTIEEGRMLFQKVLEH